MNQLYAACLVPDGKQTLVNVTDQLLKSLSFMHFVRPKPELKEILDLLLVRGHNGHDCNGNFGLTFY